MLMYSLKLKKNIFSWGPNNQASLLPAIILWRYFPQANFSWLWLHILRNNSSHLLPSFHHKERGKLMWVKGIQLMQREEELPLFSSLKVEPPPWHNARIASYLSGHYPIHCSDCSNLVCAWKTAPNSENSTVIISSFFFNLKKSFSLIKASD